MTLTRHFVLTRLTHILFRTHHIPGFLSVQANHLSIQVLQSKAAKLVLDRSLYSSSSEALSDLNWMNLSVRRQMQRCIHMYN